MAETIADRLSVLHPKWNRTRLRGLVAEGRVRVNGVVIRRFNHPVAETDNVAIAATAPPARPVPVSQNLSHRTIYEDADLIVVYKPPGLLTSTVPREPRATLFAAVQRDVARRDARAKVGLIHRLDREASGLLVFSKSDLAYQSLKSQFFHHHVERVYHAVVRGRPQPPAGRIETQLVERADGVVRSTRQTGKGDRAVTDYETVRSAGKKLTLVRVTLHTGRKHQIRVHLAGKNWSIVGDSVYGHGEPDPPPTGLMLVATRLGFAHPRTNEPVVFEIPMPEEMLKLVPEPAAGEVKPNREGAAAETASTPPQKKPAVTIRSAMANKPVPPPKPSQKQGAKPTRQPKPAQGLPSDRPVPRWLRRSSGPNR